MPCGAFSNAQRLESLGLTWHYAAQTSGRFASRAPLTETWTAERRRSVNETVLQDQVAAATAYEELHVPAIFEQWMGRVLDAARVGSGDRVLDVVASEDRGRIRHSV